MAPRPDGRAHHLEKLIDGPARIYYKYEGVSPPALHKPNGCPRPRPTHAKAGW